MASQLKLGQMLQTMREQFEKADIDNASDEAKALLSGLLDFSNLDMVMKTDLLLSERDLARIEKAVHQRCAGMPVYRILGWREFYGLRFELSDDTLEPRPDTEILVDHIFPHVNAFIKRTGSCRILDLGTGTGCIALALLNQCENAKAVGTDFSAAAVATAQKNAVNLGLDHRFEAVESDWFSHVSGRFDIVVSNPPYICSNVIKMLDQEVRDHDPILALDGGADGLNAYRAILNDVSSYINSQTVLAFEIGYDQNEQIKSLCESHAFQVIEAHRDLGGQDRLVIFKPEI